MWLEAQSFRAILLTHIFLYLQVHSSEALAFTVEELEWLQKIQEAAKDSGLPDAELQNITKLDGNVCYETECLESALEIMTATNFSVDPCKADSWVEFACARRIFNTNDTENQLAKINPDVKKETENLLTENTQNHTEYFLLHEAQIYYQQCQNKSENDVQDVKDILNYIQQKYGEWPIFSNTTPNMDFRWWEMVADMNRFEHRGYQPPFLQVTVLPYSTNVKLDISPTEINYDSETISDFTTMISRMNKMAGFRYPAVTPQVKSALRLMWNFDRTFYSVRRDGLPETVALSDLQEITDEHMKTKNITSSKWIQWKPFLKRALEGANIDFDSNPPNITLPLRDVLKILVNLEPLPCRGDLERECTMSISFQRLIVNSLYLEFAAMMVQETTKIVDDLSTFRSREESGSRADKCFWETVRVFSYALSEAHFRKFYNDEQTTPVVQKLLDNIREGYIQAVESREWMSNETKEFVIGKLQNIKTFIGLMDWMRQPGGLEAYYKVVHNNMICKSTDTDKINSNFSLDVYVRFSHSEQLNASRDRNGSYPLNFLEVNSWFLGKTREKEYKLGWAISHMDFTHINMDDAWYGTRTRSFAFAEATYNQLKNEILLYLGVLKKPIFGAEMPGFMNYAALGTVVGHEIGHSLDTTGRRYDKRGTLGEWWDAKSVEHYTMWVRNISTLYDNTEHQITPNVSLHVQSDQTINEDIADSLGIFVSFRAYKAYLAELVKEGKKEKVLPGLKGMSPQKLFYMKYTNMWCENSNIQDKYDEIMLNAGSHSRGIARATLPLQLSRDWHETFGCEWKSNLTAVLHL